MNKESIKTEIKVKEQKIGVLRINNNEYISLTDLAKYADEDDPRYPIQNWMRNKDVISYLGLWEVLTMKISNVSNSTRFKTKLAVINLKFRHKSGLKKQTLLE